MPKAGYKTAPLMQDIIKMSDEDLKRVNDFTIYNNNG
jgi:hypothetical protein